MTKKPIVKPYYNIVGNTVDPCSDFQNIISKAKTHRKQKVFIKYYTDCYNIPLNPPSCMCFELLTICELSNLSEVVRSNDDKKRIPDFFIIHHTVFQS